MRVTFLIGNGFDKQIGLDTDYNSFYKEYCKDLDTDSELIINLKKAIRPSLLSINKDFVNVDNVAINLEYQKYTNVYINSKDIFDKNINVSSKGRRVKPADWADLEEALGQYTSYLNSLEECEEVFFDINIKLKEYLKEQENRLKGLSEKNKIKIKTDFSNPVKYFRENDNIYLKEYPMSMPIDIDIINFNYTNTVEQLLDFKEDMTNAVNAIFGIDVKKARIHHIHRTLNDDLLVLGVNDATQIANEKLRSDKTINNLLVKPQENDLVSFNRNKSFVNIFNSTSIFIVFGVSFGKTDDKWWNILKDRLLHGSLILIYFYEKEPENVYLYEKEAEKKKTWFMKRIHIDETNECRNRILISFNHKLFNIGKLSDLETDGLLTTNRYSLGSVKTR